MSITNDIKYKFSTLNIAEKIIAVNVVIFILNALLVFFLQLSSDSISRWFELPKSFFGFLMQPWSIVTYAFLHAGLMHLLLNMLMLYFSARIFLNLFSKTYFLNVYFLGAISGGALFLLSYNVFPVFSRVDSPLVGASAAVMAILIFICTYLPNQEVRVIFFNLKLWYIGAAFVLLDLVQIPISNSGGHIAHLGGSLLGFVYAKKLQEGTDIGAWFAKLLSSIKNMFNKEKKSPLKTVHKQKQTSASKSKASKNEHQKQIDAILDKISKSGYDSLSKEEKDFLFKAGKE
ncbi:rhomboid family intramembrane serine protease [Joostella atrarenae]|uniref:Rhomboid family intramembrane serine protease n=1 Tax=Joostella atrarenae TaxID=679257 RepID=A0ABS9J370_9FLAO|nr:rhomboid family intramembrane serine protease [Joostella atrarenae]MCF8714839.1 rhomboid family intramembrane serine protease [Joostella atrarenae]